MRMNDEDDDDEMKCQHAEEQDERTGEWSNEQENKTWQKVAHRFSVVQRFLLRPISFSSFFSYFLNASAF